MLPVAVAAVVLSSALLWQSSDAERARVAPPGESAPTPAESPEPRMPAPPQWVCDASWYTIYVPRFCNGTRENDPPGTRPWTQPLNPPDATREDMIKTADIPYGGDLQGVRSKLRYIKDLGFTAICLEGVFADDPKWPVPLGKTWHVEPSISLPGPPSDDSRQAEHSDTEWTPGDRLLLDVVREAHQLQLKVLVGVPLTVRQSEGRPHVLPEAWRPPLDVGGAMPQMARWLKPTPGGASVEGLDGFSVTLDAKCPADLRKLLLETLHEANPNAVALGHIRDFQSQPPAFPTLAISGQAPGSLYAEPEEVDLSCTGWARFFEKQLRDASHTGAEVIIHRLSSYHEGRMANPIEIHLRETSDVKVQWLRNLRGWRLSIAVTMCLPHSIMLMYGDEVGMTGEHGPASLSPMWWLEPGSKEAPSPDYRADFTALVRLMNRIRAAHAPLRRGTFEVVLADDARRLLAFTRTYGDKQVIVVVNASNTRQEVEITAGVPGGLVGVMRPELEPLLPRSQQATVDPTKPVLVEPKLRIAGNRTIVDAAGKVRLNLDPMSLKLVLVGGDVGE